jgi:hypothetical protein
MNEELDLFGNPIQPEKMYWVNPDKQISVPSLSKADRGIQVEALKTWFFANYEDPAENTPYDGGEGGYQFIHGGPFDAHEVLNNEFAGVVPEDVIDEVVESVEHYAIEWAPRIEYDYDEYLFDSIVQYTRHYQAFAEAISNTRLLAQQEIPIPQEQHFHRILFVSVISALETYLADNFVSLVCGNQGRLRKFVETDCYFNNRMIPLKDVFKRAEGIEKEVRAYLLKLSWHRISDVRRMFFDTLNVVFPPTLEDLESAIRVRHDIVHRGGRAKDGTWHETTKEKIDKVARDAEELVWEIEQQMNPEAVRLPEGSEDGSPF